jgi:histidinol-phosphate aminotransferase
MATSRRTFLQLVGANSLAVPIWRSQGRPEGVRYTNHSAFAEQARDRSNVASDAPGVIRLSANENSNGPGEKVLAAIQQSFGRVNRYPFQMTGQLREAVAASNAVPTDHLTLGCGSSEILDAAVMACADRDRGIVTGLPTFELVGDIGKHMGVPVAEVPVTKSLELDLAEMSEKCAGAGLVYICNPNNPTGTLHGAKAIEEFVTNTLRRDPRVTILIDEAYHEYVQREDYRTAISLAMSNPRVIVSRTFSKIYGLAGLRIGYAIGQPDTIRRIDKFLDPLRLSCLSTAAALTAHADPSRVPDQRQRNHDARAYVVGVLQQAGFPVVPSEANFIMFDTKRDIRQFAADCRARGIEIARPFPPLLTHARVTIGTMDEMKKAGDVLRQALSAPPTSARLNPIEPRQFRRGELREC